MTTQTQEINQALVLSESQFPSSYVKDSQPPMEQMPLDSQVFEVLPTVPPFVLAQPNSVAHAATQKAATKEKKDGRGNNMK
ncbi:hypothetical protein D1007_03083 [Hordeum vulgare]|nr:hypothetical protein D1007_03083 [Hordeum vulgare]